MSIDPKPGLVVRYDFLWDQERQQGREDGAKDRPCAIVIASETSDGSKKVWLCPITHSPLKPGHTGVEIPPNVARHLGLDHEKSWIKTHEINSLTWEKDRIPAGITQAKPGQWSFGSIPPKLGKQMFEQVRNNSRQNQLARVGRDTTEPPKPEKPAHTPQELAKLRRYSAYPHKGQGKKK